MRRCGNERPVIRSREPDPQPGLARRPDDVLAAGLLDCDLMDLVDPAGWR